MTALPTRFALGLVFLAALATRTPADDAPTAPTSFPARTLRGYGELSAEVTNVSPTSSLLTITCADESKAKLTEAKYLSDLGLLPGVTTQPVKTARGSLAARAVAGQGEIAAVRSGHTVYVLAAQDEAGLVALCEKSVPSDGPLDLADISEKEAGVPMYLDRWDRYGMRFYYAPLVPPGHISSAPEPVNYSPQNDLDFASQSGNCGLVPWETPFPTEQAEGILKTPMWAWMIPQAEKMGLPLGVNLSMGVPCSLYNRYRDEWTMANPQYLGGYYGLLSADEGIFSWNSVAGRDAQLATLQLTVRRFNNVDNILNWLNPDGEMGHGAPDNLINWGPVADTGYRKFLKMKYGTVAAVAKRWFGSEDALGSWKDVHVPELASFLGWGKDAVDLTGQWKISHDAAAGADSASSSFDDGGWPSITAPGDAIGIVLPRTPAVLRRHITIDPKWHAAHPTAYLYVFDLSDTRAAIKLGQPGTQAFLNGTELADAEPWSSGSQSHWAAYDVSSTLKDGDNLVAVDVPQGFFNYRVYISPQAPRSYPDLGPQLNAQWADFVDWGSWSRAEAIKRGSQMIRQVDPNRPLTFMSPDSYADDIKTVVEDYGGVFHNTGYMAGVWADFHCMEMNSADLPTDLEPGGPAKTVQEFKGYLGRWSTEGIQGIDYFQHIGDVEWNQDIKAYFQNTLNLWHLIGKYHTPKAQLAIFSSDRIARLYGFPFHPNVKENFRHGHWDVRFNELLMPEFARDELMPHDFERGYADAYKVVIDSNTSVMDPELVDQIAKWVKNGGIFVTWGQTGRSTSVDKDAWPINRLTGFSVVDLDHGQKQLLVAPGQTMLPDDPMWPQGSCRGMSLQKEAPECSNLLTWGDGATAVGLRPLGKGYVIEIGPQMGTDRALKLFEAICDFAKIPRIPATAPNVLMRHFVSNNGLYDVWAMWNGKQAPVSTTLTIKNGVNLTSAWDVQSAQVIPLQQGDGGMAMPVNLDSFQTQVVLTPRQAITAAPAAWFALQRNWWRGGSGPGTGDLGAPMEGYKARYTLDLQPDWNFKNLGSDASQGATLADPKTDDSAWEKMPMGVFNITPHDAELHGMFRKTFTVPADWKSGLVTLWFTEWHGAGFLDKGQVYLDGQPIATKAILGDDLGGALKPGTTHTLAVEIWGTNPVTGTPASVWLNYRPDAPEHQDLAGNWEPAVDGLSYSPAVPIPGSYSGIALRRTVKIDSAHADQTAVIRIGENEPGIFGVIINGSWISRFHHHIGNNFDLAITPYLKFGQENQIVLFGNPKHTLTNVSLEYYTKGTYP